MFNFFGPFARDPVEQLLQLYRITHRGGGGQITTVTGISPLLLANALHKPIHKLTQYGLSTQDGTPTPDASVDIVCNNGVLRYGAMGNNLYDPSTAVFEIGYYYNPNADGAETAEAGNFIYHSYIPIEAGAAYVFYGRRKDDNRLSQYNRIHWYDAEKTYISTNTYVGGRIGKGVAPDNAVYARLSCNPQGASTAISEDTVLAYNWTFCKGTAEQAFEPFEGGIYADGTDEVLTVRGINLLDPSAVTAKKYINASGQELPSQSPTGWLNHSDYIRVTVGEDYTLSVTGTDGGSNTIAFNWFDANKTILATRPTQNVTSGTTAYTFTNTAPADAAYLIVNFITGTQAMVEQGSAPTAYEPYHAQTASVPMLLEVGDYKDTAELISGLLTHRIGIKVFNGTETWTASGTYPGSCYTSVIGQSPVGVAMCSHFANVSALPYYARGCCFKEKYSFSLWYGDNRATAVSDLTTFLAAQYAAGTPVIVVYPLATETTEQGTPHALHTTEGTNVVDVESGVGAVDLEVEYAAAAAGG